ncbi:MAG: CPBP family intramembrane metalloprotease [Anaerolineaceae bacterium]|nr:CPBP family intramembrane metalloprotease [Anaerolineaceae bacterium]
MTDFYRKSEILFAVFWIVIYCSFIGTIRGIFGEESPLTLLSLTIIASVLLIFIRKNRLGSRYGLNRLPNDCKRYLYFLPMLVLATGNLWGGIKPDHEGMAQINTVVSMALVGLVEELIFRGFLFRGLLDEMGRRSAIIIASVAFGIGHIVNLFSGQSFLETAMQIPFAIAWGFMFTMTFSKSGSLLPAIAAHSMTDVFSTCSNHNLTSDWIYTILTIIVSILYCMYLKRLPQDPRPDTETL